MPVQHHGGGCQCGAVSFEVSVDPATGVACNCSRCGRIGSIFAFAPAAEFTLLSGGGALTEYRFNNHVIRHLFCSVCGVESFARGTMPDGTPTAAINVRCLDGIDTFALEPMKYNGASA